MQLVAINKHSSARGGWPLLTADAQESAAVTITARRSRMGVPSNDLAVLEMNGKPSKPFSTASTADQVNNDFLYSGLHALSKSSS